MAGDFGGLMEVMLLVTQFFMGPIASHAFSLKAISKLYLAKTEDDFLFVKPQG